MSKRNEYWVITRVVNVAALFHSFFVDHLVKEIPPKY